MQSYRCGDVQQADSAFAPLGVEHVASQLEASSDDPSLYVGAAIPFCSEAVWENKSPPSLVCIEPVLS